MKTYKEYTEREIARELTMLGFICADATSDTLYTSVRLGYIGMLDVAVGIVLEFMDEHANTVWGETEEDWDIIAMQYFTAALSKIDNEPQKMIHYYQTYEPRIINISK